MSMSAKSNKPPTRPNSKALEAQLFNLLWIRNLIVRFKNDLGVEAEELDSWLKNYEQIETAYASQSLTAPFHLKARALLSAMFQTPTLSEVAKNLTGVYKWADALKLNRLIYTIRLSTLGPEHVDTLSTQFQIAYCLDNLNYGHGSCEVDPRKFQNGLGNSNRALNLYKTVFQKWTKIFGSTHEDTLMAQYNIAWIYERNENYSEALKQAQDIFEKQAASLTLGPDHMDTVCTQVLIAVCLQNLEKPTEAQSLYNDAYGKINSILESNSSGPHSWNAQCLVGWNLVDQGKYTEALSLFENICRQQNNNVGPDPLHLLNAHNGVAYCLCRLKEFERSIFLFKFVLEQQINIFGPIHEDVLETEHNIAWVLHSQSKAQNQSQNLNKGDEEIHQEALDLFTKVYKNKLQLLGPNHTSTQSTKRWVDLMKKN